MVDFVYQEMFPLKENTTEYRRITDEHVSLQSFEGHEILNIEARGLTLNPPGKNSG